MPWEVPRPGATEPCSPLSHTFSFAITVSASEETHWGFKMSHIWLVLKLLTMTTGIESKGILHFK